MRNNTKEEFIVHTKESGPVSIPIENTDHPKATHSRARLKKVFDVFEVKYVKLPTDMETRRHQCFCKFHQLATIVEMNKVSGKICTSFISFVYLRIHKGLFDRES